MKLISVRSAEEQLEFTKKRHQDSLNILLKTLIAINVTIHLAACDRGNPPSAPPSESIQAPTDPLKKWALNGRFFKSEFTFKKNSIMEVTAVKIIGKCEFWVRTPEGVPERVFERFSATTENPTKRVKIRYDVPLQLHVHQLPPGKESSEGVPYVEMERNATACEQTKDGTNLSFGESLTVQVKIIPPDKARAGELTRELASEILQDELTAKTVKYVEFRKGAGKLAVGDGWIVTSGRSVTGPLAGFSDKFKKAYPYENSIYIENGDNFLGSPKVGFADGIKETVAEITGIAEGANINEKTVEFTSRYRFPTSSLGFTEKYLYAGTNYSIKFRKYDDGWRADKIHKMPN